MGRIPNPALTEFLAAMGERLILAQVRSTRVAGGYELRHAADSDLPSAGLRIVKPQDARTLAQHNTAGAFRPLKSAPNLSQGWVIHVSGEGELEDVLNQLYPGAIADWYAARRDKPPITHFREFTGRQSGMYRITAMLDDSQAAAVTRACCDRSFCLKRRLWTVEGLSPDGAAAKSIIPCLDPCAVFLEFARQAMRIEQHEKVRLDLSPVELSTLRAAIEHSLASHTGTVLEGDMSAPLNPRRLQLLLAKLESVSQLAPEAAPE
jgi:hypothetical protein